MADAESLSAALPLLKELLAIDQRAAKARWESMDEEHLESEIERYKQALKEVMEEFGRLGEAAGRAGVRAGGRGPRAGKAHLAVT